jgi:hypothetical protein
VAEAAFEEFIADFPSAGFVLVAGGEEVFAELFFVFYVVVEFF